MRQANRVLMWRSSFMSPPNEIHCQGSNGSSTPPFQYDNPNSSTSFAATSWLFPNFCSTAIDSICCNTEWCSFLFVIIFRCVDISLLQHGDAPVHVLTWAVSNESAKLWNILMKKSSALANVSQQPRVATIRPYGRNEDKGYRKSANLKKSTDSIQMGGALYLQVYSQTLQRHDHRLLRTIEARGGEKKLACPNKMVTLSALQSDVRYVFLSLSGHTPWPKLCRVWNICSVVQ